MSAVGPGAALPEVDERWSGTVEADRQPRRPLRVGVATALGILLVTGPYMGVNAVLLPSRIAEIAPREKAEVVALLATCAMVVAAVANIVMGALSDLTRSRWGRRTPWMVAGSVLTAATLFLVDSVHGVGLLVVVWCVYQLGLNAVIAPVIATISDRVAPQHRGAISSVYSLGFSGGIYGGQLLGAQFLGSVSTGIHVLALLSLLAGPVAAFVLRERSSLPMPRRRLDARLLADFSLPRRGARDYYLALVGKLAIVSAKFSISGYQLYIFTDYMRLDGGDTARYVSWLSLFLMVTALAVGVVAGPLSDRLRRRRAPVVGAGLLIAVGALIPFFSARPWTMLVYGLVAGIGMGAFNSVDQALNVDVLPDRDTTAKDLGILNLANTGGQVLGPVLAAAVITAVGYHALFPLAGALALLGTVPIALIRSVD